jgi:beta-lactamase regulating signal transducer with metallopeptidase domain
MTPIAHAISSALLHFVWQGLVIAILLRVTLAVLRRNSPRLRYAASCAALAVMSALPLITAVVVYRGPGVAASRATLVPSLAVPSAAADLAAPAFLGQLIAVLEVWALPVWASGVLIFAIRLLWVTRQAARLRRSGEPANPGLADAALQLARRLGVVRTVRVLTSEMIDTPSVVGWLEPVILFPPVALLRLSARQLETVLVHELAHIRRHDYLVNLFQLIVEALFFYQPAVWWVSSLIRRERELCCDDVVVEVCGDPLAYARALTQLERSRVMGPDLALASTAGPLTYRVRRLTGVLDPRPAARVSAGIPVGLALAGLLISMQWVGAQPQGSAEGAVRREAIWVDTVKYGDLAIRVRATGRMATANTADLNVPEPLVKEVELGQSATVEVAGGITAAGRVKRIFARAMDGTVTVTIELQAQLNEFSGRTVDGVIDIRTLHNVIYVGRPAGLDSPEGTLFRIDAEGQAATRVKVRYGAAAADKVQVLDGLRPGDKVILSDMARYTGTDRVRLE